MSKSNVYELMIVLKQIFYLIYLAKEKEKNYGLTYQLLNANALSTTEEKSERGGGKEKKRK